MYAAYAQYYRRQRNIAKIRLLSIQLKRNNTRWRGQEREGGVINLDLLEPDAWVTYFRFSRDEIARLADALQLPPYFHAGNRIKEERFLSLCMLLARLVYPARLADLHMQFGWKPERVSRITTAVLQFIYENWKHLLVFDTHLLCPNRLAAYTIAVREKDAPLETCWGFIDGTMRRIAKPKYGQESVYNGWKRGHFLKYQAVVAPDGLIAHLYGPVEGRLHDSAIFNESELLTLLEAHAYKPDGTPVQIYSDPAYGINEYLISPYKGVVITQDQREWNKAMSRVRIVVEWAFKEVAQQFAYVDFVKNQRVLLSPIGVQYIVAVILHNAHVCLHHPQITQYFQVNPNQLPNDFSPEDMPALADPPLLEAYFHINEENEVVH